jgi:Fe-S-cluster containining protein
MYPRTEEIGGDDRVEFLKSAGLVFTTEGGATTFRQPCPAFGAGCCTVYDSRPSSCRGYRCVLLRRVEAGDVSQDDARELIDRTIAIRDRVRSGLRAYVATEDALSLDGLYRMMLAKFDTMPDPAATRREHAALLFDVVALRVILAREFEPRDSHSHRPDEKGEGKGL